MNVTLGAPSWCFPSCAQKRGILVNPTPHLNLFVIWVSQRCVHTEMEVRGLKVHGFVC